MGSSPSRSFLGAAAALEAIHSGIVDQPELLVAAFVRMSL